MPRYSDREFEKLLASNPELRFPIAEYISDGSGNLLDVTAMPTPEVVKRKNKYGNRKAEADGYMFDSIKERNRYLELKRMEETGEISGLVLQPRFVLLEPFVDSSGKRQRGITYTADFQFVQDEYVISEDVKSSATASNQNFRIKWKWVQYLHKNNPKMIFRLVI